MKLKGAVSSLRSPFWIVLTAVIALLFNESSIATLTESGSIVSWNSYVQPTLKSGTHFVSSSAGYNHNLSLTSSGTVVAWGWNDFDQGTVPEGATSGVKAVAAGTHYSLALTINGSVLGWGDNQFGQTSVPMEAQTNVVAIAAGPSHALALKADGSVLAWGWNFEGQTSVPTAAKSGVVAIAAGGAYSVALKGNGSVVVWGNNGQSSVPVAAQTGVVAIATGNSHVLALKTDGSVVAWGRNDYGQLLVPVAAQSGVVAISAGAFHCLALKADGSIVAWGLNQSGQANIPVAAQTGVSAIACGYSHNVIIRTDGAVVVWGDNDFGQTTPPEDAKNGIISVAAGNSHSVALRFDGSVFAWGLNDRNQTSIPLNAQTGVVAVAAGFFHSLALKGDGSVIAWGSDDYHQTEVPSEAKSGVTALAAGGQHSIALKGDGSVVGWGANDSGQATTPDYARSGIVAVAAGFEHTVGLKSDGSVVAWGNNYYGQNNVPLEAKHGVSAIAAAGYYTVALKTNGSVLAWGDNQYGQLNVPANASSNVIAIAAGGFYGAALKIDGSVVTWGANSKTPILVPDEAKSGVISIAAGGDHFLAIKSTLESNAILILRQPITQIIREGNLATLLVSVESASPVRFQWQKDGIDLQGATEHVLLIPSVTPENAGRYNVRIFNPYNAVVSQGANLTVARPLVFTPTTDTPAGVTATSLPVVYRGLDLFRNSAFDLVTTDNKLDTNLNTIVLTHGWIPSLTGAGGTDGEDGWPKEFASVLVTNGFDKTANIVAWDWSLFARSVACNVEEAARRAPELGILLGQQLASELGDRYAGKIHFVGHSLGTLVNAAAADYIHGHGFDWQRTHMTLFDEASVGQVTDCSEIVKLVTYKTASGALTIRPLPSQFLWADNYISLVGNLAPNVVNVILENGFPSMASGIAELGSKAIDFHGYPMNWYIPTIATNLFPVGHLWSFERGGFLGAPAPGTVYQEVQEGSTWKLQKMGSYEEAQTVLMNRWLKYHVAVDVLLAKAIGEVFLQGNGLGEVLYFSPIAVNLILHLATTQRTTSLRVLNVIDPPVGNPVYTRMSITIPATSRYMGFQFKAEGDARTDFFAFALDRTNVFSKPLSTVQTNLTLSSGLIDVSRYAGQSVEMFFGILGGTSTNATVDVEDLQFYAPAPLSVKAKVSEQRAVISWPALSDKFSLETTTNLFDKNSWGTISAPSAIVDFENVFTNATMEGPTFFRLKNKVVTSP